MQISHSTFLSINIFAQQVKLDGIENNFKNKDIFKIRGGISSNSIYTWGNANALRDPFNYFVNGNINISFANLIQLPLSFSITNT